MADGSSSSSVADALLGTWNASGGIPITYEFMSANKLKIYAQEKLISGTIEYEVDVSKAPYHLDISHNGGPLGTGKEQCIFDLRESNNALIITSPSPNPEDPGKFGPRPSGFSELTTATFYRPGYEETKIYAAVASVEKMSDEDQMIQFFDESAKVYRDVVEKSIKIVKKRDKTWTHELQLLRLQGNKRASDIQAQYSRVKEKITECLWLGNGSKYGSKVAESFKRFCEKVRILETLDARLRSHFNKEAEPSVGVTTPAAPPSSSSSSSTPPATQQDPSLSNQTS